MQSLQTVSVRSQELSASADAIWSLVGDFARMDTWADGVLLLRVEGTGEGAVRHVSTRAGNFIERCDSVDAHGWSLRYSIVESPWPIRGYHATVRVIPLNAHSCVIEWSSEFETLEHAPENFAANIERMYAGFIARIRSVASVR
jgi:Polyketide cyclase / dehydrase and lipid transport